VKNLKISKFSHRFENFLHNLKFEDRIFLVFDTDVDGISSGVITLETFRKLGIKISKIIPCHFGEIKYLDVKNFDAGIIVDVPTDTQEKFLRKTNKKILYIDHHPFRDVNSKNVFYINPRLIKKDIYQPTSYTTYKLFSDFVGLDKVKWIAVLGTVGDYGFKDVKDLYKNTVKIKRKEKVTKNVFWKAAVRLDAAISVYGSKKTFHILEECTSLSDFFSNYKIKNAYKKFRKEVVKTKKSLKRNLEIYPDVKLIFCKLAPKYFRITSALATEIAVKNPNSFIVFARREGKIYKVSARMENGRIDAGKVMQKFGGGGHKAAAGCVVNAEDLLKFKKKLIEILRKKK